MKKLFVPAGLVLFACTISASASPPKGVSAEILTRGAYQPFKVKTDHASPIDFQAIARSEFDIVVRQHTYEPHGYTGWHKYPGPVFITVTQGALTFYAHDDPTCTPTVVRKGRRLRRMMAMAHIGVNQSDEHAMDLSVILAPVGGPFRDELPLPEFDCGF